MSRRLAALRRSLDAMPSPVEDRPGLLLRDPFGYTEEVVIIAEVGTDDEAEHDRVANEIRQHVTKNSAIALRHVRVVGPRAAPRPVRVRRAGVVLGALKARGELQPLRGRRWTMDGGRWTINIEGEQPGQAKQAGHQHFAAYGSDDRHDHDGKDQHTGHHADAVWCAAEKRR